MYSILIKIVALCIACFSSDNDDRCTAVFINKGVTVNATDGKVTVEWEGTGPGVTPDNTVNLFTCEINENPPTPCKLAILILFLGGEWSGVNFSSVEELCHPNKLMEK